jgi:hypothetical protein
MLCSSKYVLLLKSHLSAALSYLKAHPSVEISKNHVLQFLDKKLPKTIERKETRIRKLDALKILYWTVNPRRIS